MKQIHNKNVKMKEIENREGECLEELLRRKYVDENKLIQTIANELRISYLTAHRWLKQAGIYSKRLDI